MSTLFDPGTSRPSSGHFDRPTLLNGRGKADTAQGSQPAQGMDVVRAKPATSKKSRNRMLLIAGGIVLALAITLGLSRLRGAAPTVDRGSVLIATVTRGPMVRSIQGPGTLVPEEVRWLSARTPARVDVLHVRPGAKVEPDTVLLELSNPDVQLQALEAERQLSQAQAELATTSAERNSDQLAQQSLIETLKADLAEATRRARADESLAAKEFLSKIELEQSQGRAASLASRLDFEQRRLATQSKGTDSQLQALREQVERLRAIAEFRRKEVDGLRVVAGITGVVQEVPLQVGQAVPAGALLARVAKPDRLKAEIRVPETQAKDVQPGQLARVDTRNGIAEGRVARVDPAAQGGTVRVDVVFDQPLPAGARPDLSVDGVIELEKLNDAVFVDRPALVTGPGTTSLFKLVDGGAEAVRVPVQWGRLSSRSVEVVSGLQPGDQIILTDMARWDRADRLRLR